MNFSFITRFRHSRFFALMQKEIAQILRDKQLIVFLILPATVELTLFGFALSPEVNNLRIAVADLSSTPVSRALVSAIVENHVFDVAKIPSHQNEVVKSVADGQADAGLIIPPEFNRQIKSGTTATVQVVLDGVDANSAGIANGYLKQTVSSFNDSIRQHPTEERKFNTDITFLYNPGLASPWYFVPGMLGLVLTLAGGLIAATSLMREKESGTLEQLVMTPASSTEILLAKLLPLFLLLFVNVACGVAVGTLIFNIPFRGSPILYMGVSTLGIFISIALGVLLAAFANDQRQAILSSFFVNIPLFQLSGLLSPYQTMPQFLQYVSLLDPVRYYIVCIRAILLKGVGLESIWFNVVVLAGFAFVLLFVSIKRFRTQLG
ncbi:MAG TPA: ABC transporter permease [Oculatellaceae cyanobacterium]